ncbi:MAG: hypothetical protein IJ326_09430 [Lachnospiraceae bacterium]|nr:hypothetical protein [Lachnospiraceae bacterium]
MSNYDEHRYDDIINLPHHVSSKHPHMPALDRAAQFSPFAALTGHDAAIKETARLTDEQVELDEERKEELDRQLQEIRAHLSEHPEVTITFFVPDERKDGGSYVTVTGRVKKLDEYEGRIILEDNTIVKISMICMVKGCLNKEF